MSQKIKPNTNTGFIPQDPLPTDWRAGAESGIVQTPIMPSADWSSFLPTNESQIGLYLDTDACVTFSALNCLEIQLDFMITNNLLSEKEVQWLIDNGYIDENGHVNFSDRFTAKMSGTTIKGNYMGAVWDSARNDGLVPEKDWSFPYRQQTPVFDWDDYYSEIPQELKDKGQEFRKHFEIMYEWLAYPGKLATSKQLNEFLKMSPLHIATAVCPPWNTSDIIKGCGFGSGHCTTMYHVKLDECFQIFDHYNPYQKRFSLDYVITYAMRGVITVKQPTPALLSFTHIFKTPIKYGETSNEVGFLQDALKQDKVFPLTVKSTKYYGDITKIAVLTFQKKYKVASPQELAELDGKSVGPKTRKKLNELFAQE